MNTPSAFLPFRHWQFEAAPVRRPISLLSPRCDSAQSVHPGLRLRELAWLSLLAVITGIAFASPAQELHVIPEHASAAIGPWTGLDPALVQLEADGSLLVPSLATNEFFRLRIGPGRSATDGRPLLLEQAPTNALKIARNLLNTFMGGVATGDDDQRWEGVKLGPLVYPVYGAGFANGQSPAYLEFKVIRSSNAPPLGGTFLKTAPTDTTEEFGYITVSLVQSDFPVAEFATRGPTVVEKLHKLAGTPNVKPFRYGSTLMVAEDLQGNLVANWGAQPFKPDPNVITVGRTRPNWHGNDTNVDVRPPSNPLASTGYASYSAFKRDYMTNAVYQYLRNRRTVMAHAHWMIETGQYPEIVTVGVGQSITILPNEQVTAFGLDDGDSVQSIARISFSRSDPGLVINGTIKGGGMLTVQTSQNIYFYALHVTGSALAGGAPPPVGWQPMVYFYAGTWDDQPKYSQLKRPEFCQLVGCGPTAWAMFFAWVERNQGIKAAFNDFFTIDAPPDTDSSANRSKLYPEVSQLYDYCSVICNPFGDDGATAPGNMMDAGLTITFIPTLGRLIHRSWNMGWTLWDDCPEDGALRCRDAVKKGYPGVVGLGWLWHYALAYGYAFQQFYLAPDTPYLTARYLKCNMGWGSDDPPRWYNLCDTFLDSDFHITAGENAP